MAGGAGNGAGPGDAAARRQRLVDELKLDSGQVARLDEILGEMRTRLAEVRDLPEQERRPRAERVRADVRQRINGMLNAEQQKLYAEIVAGETGRAGGATGSGRVFVPAAAGPLEVRLRTGLTDGNVTEVVSGELNEGQDVIVGTQQPATAARPMGSGPRLPL
jgi:HlyD family secretion protein